MLAVVLTAALVAMISVPVFGPVGWVMAGGTAVAALVWYLRDTA